MDEKFVLGKRKSRLPTYFSFAHNGISVHYPAMTDDALPIWATNLRALREGAGLTSREVSARLGMAATTYATWEQGRSEPRFSALLAICDLFSVTPNDILVGPQKDDLMQALRRSAQARKLLTAALDALR